MVVEPKSYDEEAKYNYNQLTDLYADIEGDESWDKLAWWQTKITKYRGKSEPVQETEGEDYEGSPWGKFVREDIFNCNENNRGRY